MPGAARRRFRILPRWGWRAWLLACSLSIALGLPAAAWLVGTILMAPVRRQIPPPPADLQCQEIRFESATGLQLRGWVSDLPAAKVTVLHLHGLQGSRQSGVARMRFLRRAGYAVMCFDFRSHGESEGDQITFGYLEAYDVRAAVAYARARWPRRKLVVLAESLGAAACVLGPSRDQPLEVDAMILEMLYPQIEDAVGNRVSKYLGSIPSAIISPLLLVQFPLRLDIETADLQPIEGIKNLRAPVFVMGGGDDRLTPPAETEKLYAAAPQPKRLWIVPEAPHRDLYSSSGQAYEAKVLDFLGEFAPAR